MYVYLNDERNITTGVWERQKAKHPLYNAVCSKYNQQWQNFFLTLKAPSKICSRQHSKKNFFFFFQRKKSWHFMWIICWNVKTCFLWKKKNNNNNNKKMLPAAVVTGALRDLKECPDSQVFHTELSLRYWKILTLVLLNKLEATPISNFQITLIKVVDIDSHT